MYLNASISSLNKRLHRQVIPLFALSSNTLIIVIAWSLWQLSTWIIAVIVITLKIGKRSASAKLIFASVTRAENVAIRSVYAREIPSWLAGAAVAATRFLSSYIHVLWTNYHTLPQVVIIGLRLCRSAFKPREQNLHNSAAASADSDRATAGTASSARPAWCYRQSPGTARSLGGPDLLRHPRLLGPSAVAFPALCWYRRSLDRHRQSRTWLRLIWLTKWRREGKALDSLDTRYFKVDYVRRSGLQSINTTTGEAVGW